MAASMWGMKARVASVLPEWTDPKPGVSTRHIPESRSGLGRQTSKPSTPFAFSEFFSSETYSSMALTEIAVHSAPVSYTHLVGLVSKLSRYVGAGVGEDLKQRLEHLEKTSDEFDLLHKIERVISERGMVAVSYTHLDVYKRQVFDMLTALAFYRDVLGFAVVSASPEVETAEGRFSHWMWLRFGGAEIMLNTQYDSNERPMQPPEKRSKDAVFYIGCPDVEIAYQELTDRGLKAERPKIAPYGLSLIHIFLLGALLRSACVLLLVFSWMPPRDLVPHLLERGCRNFLQVGSSRPVTQGSATDGVRRSYLR